MNRNTPIILAAALLACANLAWGANVADGDIKMFQAGDTLKAADMNQNFTALKQGVNSKQDRVSGACTAGSAVKQINVDGTVACESVAGGAGDITGVTAGTGLSGGGDSGTVSLSVNTAVIQNRVSQSCAGYSAIKTVNSDGTVLCETILPPNPGDITAVIAGTGLTGGALSGDATLAVDPAYVQRRVSSTCAVGSSVRAIAADGAVTCETAAVTAAQWSSLQTTITNLQTALVTANNLIVSLQSTVNSHDTTLTTHASQITAINNNAVLALGKYVTVTDPPRGFAKATFSGINLQLVNGSGQTDVANGLGNLIIGYDAARNDTTNFCSDGQYSDQTTCQGAGKIWAVSHKSGSHYLVIGDSNNYSQYGGMVVGSFNTSNRGYASVSGGTYNTANGLISSVSGGERNVARGAASSVSGGQYNTASGEWSSVSGGIGNTANNGYGSVSGGSSNTASGNASSVSGGYNNTASGYLSSVSGGDHNTASGSVSSVSGGSTRSAIGEYDWAAGVLFQTQ